jgi:hypothetical protein
LALQNVVLVSGLAAIDSVVLVSATDATMAPTVPVAGVLIIGAYSRDERRTGM